ncbi:hypothetical protein GOP47_0008869 [Adiantum capillus-veneris]|uniref:Uncharacterized protein n=1 Tax=Adiantum capillus-veneris TaxID=13818 RepID=A0A9D4UZE4_ADICA|nr:hypothetical protein GOP47_0008869 [Adiantum capillus-veneris]
MFACGGKINAAQFSLPCSFYVQGLGELPLPLSPSNIFHLIDLSEQAPYIKGSATAGDKSVREARQIDASFLTCHPLNSTFFLHTAQAIAAHAVERLGMDAHNVHLDAKPYKLLLYEAGGQFAFHRGTERELGMSGTLIIQIPTLSLHQGDQLVVHNAHNSVTFDFSGGKSSRHSSSSQTRRPFKFCHTDGSRSKGQGCSSNRGDEKVQEKYATGAVI